MKSVFGSNLIISLFGESHGECVGATIHNLPAGIKIDYDFINSEIERRKPKNEFETKRREDDSYKFISGIYNGYTNGAPVTVLIPNEKFDSSCYDEGVIRPGTSDLPHYIRTEGFGDLNGSGHFSGRLTAPLVVIGAICKKILNNKNIKIESSLSSALEPKTNDTTGFSLKLTIKGLPIGIGEPFFDSMESVLAHLLFSIPSVKGVSFGDDDIDKKYGSEVIDEIRYLDHKIKIMNNHNGGINGGLSNGNDCIINIKFKPISSIPTKQNTINIKTKENIEYIINGHHDLTIKNRCGVITENIIAIGILDLLTSFYNMNWITK